MNGDAVYFDLETGGLEMKHPVIQVAAIAVRDWVEVEPIEVKIRFNLDDCAGEALEMNCYTPEAWQREALEKDVAVGKLNAFFRRHAKWKLLSAKGNHYETAKIVGHNAVQFDAPRLKAMWDGKYAPFSWFYPLDTLQLALWHFSRCRCKQPENFKLGTLCEFFDIPTEGAHDALEDVRMTIALAKALSG